MISPRSRLLAGRSFFLTYLLSAVIVSGSLCACSGCRGPKPDRTTVKGTFALYMGSSARGNYEAMYPMLVTQLRDKTAMAHRNMQECVRLIKERFPARMKADALKTVWSPEVRSARTPDQYMASIMGVAGRPTLDIQERLASKIRRIRRVKPGTFMVTTVSGANLRFVLEGDGLFYLVPDLRDVALIQDAYVTSIQRLNAARKTIESSEKEG